MILSPGRASLAEWRAIHRGAVPQPRLRLPAGGGSGAAAVAAIVAKGEAVYGINTGFGKLAQVRIAASDLATLQRNIVLSHAAGVGEPLPPEVVRLVLALKLGSLARGASGVRWPVVATLEACLARGLLPVVPSQGSVGASGDLAPLAHMTAALMGVGAFLDEGEASGRRSQRHGLAPLELGPKEGLGAAQRHAGRAPPWRWRGCSRQSAPCNPPSSPAPSPPTPRRAATGRSTRASTPCAATADRSRRRRRCAR